MRYIIDALLIMPSANRNPVGNTNAAMTYDLILALVR